MVLLTRRIPFSSPPFSLRTFFTAGGPPIKRPIRSLDPAKQLLDDIIDLSGAQWKPRVRLVNLPDKPVVNLPPYYPDEAEPTAFHKRTSNGKRKPQFPLDTRGCFYFHSPDPRRVPEAAELRFRLDPHSPYDPPTDLLTPTGVPYSIPLVLLVSAVRFHPLALQLLHDGLVDRYLLQTCSALGADAYAGYTGPEFHNPLIHSLGQPFFLDFTKKNHVFLVLGHHRLERVRLRLTTPAGLTSRIVRGSVLVSFERAPPGFNRDPSTFNQPFEPTLTSPSSRTLVLCIHKVIHRLHCDQIPAPIIPLAPNTLCPQSPLARFFPTESRFPMRVWNTSIDDDLKGPLPERKFLRLLLPEPLEEWEKKALEERRKHVPSLGL